MTIAKHTPGPWEISTTVNTTTVNIFGTPENAVYHIGTLTGSSIKHVEEFKANAHLIAAAPQMKALIEKTVDALAT